MYSWIDDNDYKHLICIILDGSEIEDRLHGLAHVGEHMCLLSYFENDASYTTYGYTCIDHAVLYFTSKTQESLFKIQSMIEDMSIIRKDRVEIAKHQVIAECMNLSHEIEKGESTVRFITDNRVKNYSAGKIADIRNITEEDVTKWLDRIIVEKRLHFFWLDNLSEDQVDKQIKCPRVYTTDVFDYHSNKVQLQLENIIKKDYYDADFYMPLDIIFEKSDYMQLIIGEYFLEQYLGRFFQIDSIEEKFFSFTERYLVIRAKEILLDEIPSLINKIREIDSCDISDQYLECKKDLYQLLAKLKEEYVEESGCILNMLVKKLAYGVPVLKLSTDIELIKGMDNRLNSRLIKCLNAEIKIIVR